MLFRTPSFTARPKSKSRHRSTNSSLLCRSLKVPTNYIINHISANSASPESQCPCRRNSRRRPIPHFIHHLLRSLHNTQHIQNPKYRLLAAQAARNYPSTDQYIRHSRKRAHSRHSPQHSLDLQQLHSNSNAIHKRLHRAQTPRTVRQDISGRIDKVERDTGDLLVDSVSGLSE